jgi:hypothetical protein
MHAACTIPGHQQTTKELTKGLAENKHAASPILAADFQQFEAIAYEMKANMLFLEWGNQVAPLALQLFWGQ